MNERVRLEPEVGKELTCEVLGPEDILDPTTDMNLGIEFESAVTDLWHISENFRRERVGDMFPRVRLCDTGSLRLYILSCRHDRWLYRVRRA